MRSAAVVFAALLVFSAAVFLAGAFYGANSQRLTPDKQEAEDAHRQIRRQAHVYDAPRPSGPCPGFWRCVCEEFAESR